jgi:hypothetical protein
MKTKDYTDRVVELTSLYPVRKSLFSFLSASDLSSFVYAFNICRNKKRYMYISLTSKEQELLNPIRDIPEYYSWALERMAQGDKVILVGKDLDLLTQRIGNPWKYWRQGYGTRELCVWLAVVGKLVLDWGPSNGRLWTNTRTLEVSTKRKNEEGLRVDYLGLTHDISRCSEWTTLATVFSPLPFTPIDWFVRNGVTKSAVFNENKLIVVQVHSEDQLASNSPLTVDLRRCNIRWDSPRIIGRWTVEERDTDWSSTPYIDLSENVPCLKIAEHVKQTGDVNMDQMTNSYGIYIIARNPEIYTTVALHIPLR